MGLTNNIVRGMFILFNKEPHLVVDREFYSPGKGGAFNRVKLKSLKTGKIISQTIKTNEKVEEIDVETRTMQFIYVDGNDAYFMDPKTYDQISVPLSLIEGGSDYLHADGKYVTISYEGEVLSVQLPSKLTLVVTETTDATRGNTANNATKEAVLETGARVQVPLFIKQGERIIINTQTETYVGKAD
jgi:elongation factor P